MSKPSDNPADPFKKALAETTKVMADDADLAVSFEVCVQRANIVIIEGDEAVLFPTVLVEVGSW